MTPRGDFAVPLPAFGALSVSGADAQTFLQGQCTGEVTAPDAPGGMNAWCNPKGQVVADFLLAGRGDDYVLVMPRALAGDFAARLGRYVLRAAVEITDLSSATVVGLGSAGMTQKRTLPWPDGRRAVVVADPADARQWQQTPAQNGTEQQWQGLDIEAGIPWITPATAESVLPQEINLDIIGALSLKKGCFPGQEVVARVHYRGRLKRRMGRLRAAATEGLEPGAALYHGGGDVRAGTVINVVADGDDVDMLAVLDSTLSKGDVLRTVAGIEFPLDPHALPYAVPA